MRFIAIGTWGPEQRDGIVKQRLEKGRMLPKGVNVLGEWLDVSGGRQILLFECNNALEVFEGASKWNNLYSFECFPVVEVKDDKETQIA